MEELKDTVGNCSKTSWFFISIYIKETMWVWKSLRW